MTVKKRIIAILIATLIYLTIVSATLTVYFTAENGKNFNQSAYSFDYEDVLLDMGDGNVPLIAKDGNYSLTEGIDGGKASSSGAILDPALFSSKSGLTFSFATVFSKSSGTSIFNEAEKIASELSKTDTSGYTENSKNKFNSALSDLKKAISSSSNQIVSKIHAAEDAKDELVKNYSKSEAITFLNESKTVNLLLYTSSSANVFKNKLSALEIAISSDSGYQTAAEELYIAKEDLVYLSYKDQAEKELSFYENKLSNLNKSVYTENSYSDFSSSVSALKNAVSSSASDGVLASKTADVKNTYSKLKAADLKSPAPIEIFTAKGNGGNIKVFQKGDSVFAEFTSGSSTASVSSSVSEYLSKSQFVTVTVVLSSSNSTSLDLYVNGNNKGTDSVSGKLSSLICTSSAFPSGVTVDNIYVASKAISSNDCSKLVSGSMEDFLRYMDPSWIKPSDRIVITPITNFKWSAYTFDNGLKTDSDLNGIASCSYNAIKLEPVDTAAYGGSFGMGLIRRSGIYPKYYLSLENGLLSSSESFTVCGFVHAVDSSETSASFLEISGKNGNITFAPFSSKGSKLSYVSPDKKSGSVNISGGNILSGWVHYALTFDSKGHATVYVNGKSVATADTGISLKALEINGLKIISGITSGEKARIVLDDVYVSSNVMSSSDIRKMSYYGVERFVGEVLPDPDTGKIDEGDEKIDLTADEIDALEDGFNENAMINGYVGTTFDDVSLIGQDTNGSVFATVRNASLIQGLYKYGLNLNGKTAYLRYPKGIFDNTAELSISIAYNWLSTETVGERTQKLFSISKKADSVSDPSAYITLDMGDGKSGMKLLLSDGNSKTEIKTDKNFTNEWKRATVTVNNGNVKLYIDTDLVAEKKIDFDLVSLCPNFNYIGKSAVKGDPLFCGVVDEIYISEKEMSVDDIKSIMTGIVPYVAEKEQTELNKGDSWDGILIGMIVFMIILFLAFVGFIIYMLFFKK